MRTAGKTLSLPKSPRQKLDDTYESIYIHNRQCREKSPSNDPIIDKEFVKLIDRKLKHLEKEISNILKIKV